MSNLSFKNFNKFLLSALFLCIVLLGVSQKEINDGGIKSFSGQHIPFAEMDQFLITQMDSIGIPGLSIAIINDAKVIYHRALGIKDIDTQEKVNEQSLFDAASTSKSPFAYLALRMVDQGLLDLDTPLYTYLPFPDIAHDERYKLITARMVLSHTSGFPNWRFFNDDGKLDIKFTPGTGFQYSGEGFEYLADVLAHLNKVERNDLQGFMENEVSIPLQMKHTYYTWNDYVTANRVSGHYEGKLNPGWGANAKAPNFRASYSLQTEAKSYAEFVIGLMLETGLKKNTFDEMFKVHVDDPRSNNHSWALGLVVESTDHGTLYGHGGDNKSFTCGYKFSKEKKIGYVFFTNSELGSKLDEKLLAYLMNK